MDDAEAAEVVALTLALDPYGYGEQTEESINFMVDAWTLAMPDVNADYAKRAVVEHYRTTGKRIAVSDVIAGARDIEIRDRATLRVERLRQRHAADRQALPAPAPRRDRTRDIAELLAEHRNWDPIGDLSTRRRQADWNPALAQAYREALRQRINRERSAEAPAEVRDGDLA